MRKTEAGIVADVLTAAARVTRGPGIWLDRLPADVQSELEGIRRAVLAGELPHTKSAVAKGVESALRARGLPAVKWPEVVKWLDGKR